MSRSFVHLHVLSGFSWPFSVCTVGKLAEAAARLGMPALALTDRDTLAGAVRFIQDCRKRSVKPIIGCELSVFPAGGPDPGLFPEGRVPLVLLARNDLGYFALCEMVSALNLAGDRGGPRSGRRLLEKHAPDLVALSPGLRGEIPTLLRHVEQRAEEAARRLEALFGRGFFFLGIQDHGLPEEHAVNDRLVALSRKTGIPLAAVNDVRCLEAADGPALEVQVRLAAGEHPEPEAAVLLASGEFHFKTAEAMEALFRDLPEALDNTLIVTDRCNLSLEFPLWTGHDFDTDDPGEFRKAVWDGFAQRLAEAREAGDAEGPHLDPEAYRARLEYEMDAIEQRGGGWTLLRARDVVRRARSEGIPVGPGQGGAPGSLVNWALGLTAPDPVRHGLFFERFLDPERSFPPEIVLMVGHKRREEAARLAVEVFGPDRVCRPATFTETRPKALVREVGRALGVPDAVADRVARLIPSELFMTLEKAPDAEPRLAEAMRSDPTVRRLVEIASRFEGLPHPGPNDDDTLLVGPCPLAQTVPLRRGPGGRPTAQFDRRDAETIGLWTLDILGLKALTILDDTLRRVRELHGEAPDLRRLAPDDPAALAIFAERRTEGIFEFDSPGTRRVLRRLEPEGFEDVLALYALYRPGPIRAGMLEEFIRKRHDPDPIHDSVPVGMALGQPWRGPGTRKRVCLYVDDLEPILRPTRGVLVFQEQVMAIAVQLAGFSREAANAFRKNLGKKRLDVLDQTEGPFVKGCIAHGIGSLTSTSLFKWLRTYGEYTFTKAHALARTGLAWQLAALKARYPEAFEAALRAAGIRDEENAPVQGPVQGTPKREDAREAVHRKKQP